MLIGVYVLLYDTENQHLHPCLTIKCVSHARAVGMYIKKKEADSKDVFFRYE